MSCSVRVKMTFCGRPGLPESKEFKLGTSPFKFGMKSTRLEKMYSLIKEGDEYRSVESNTHADILV